MRGLINVLLRRLAVRRNVSIGRNFHVGPRSVIWAPRSLEIGNRVYVGKNVTIEVDGRIGDGVLVANNVGIVGRRDHDRRQVGTPIRDARWVGDAPEHLSLPVTIGSDVWIGFGAVVLSGITVGDSAIVSAGAVVVTDVPSNTIVAGNPAKPVRPRFSPVELDEHWSALRKAGFRLDAP